jgi:Tol biopolymer transport system component
MNVDGSDQRRLSPAAGLSQYVTWSPDGLSLAYSHNDDPDAAQDDADWHIVAQRLDSPDLTVVSTSWGTWPTWGPAGIVFTSREIVGGEAQLSLSLVQPDGTGLILINPTRDRDEHYPRWSADGRRLLYVAGDSKRPQTRQVWVMNADGSDAHPLTAGIGGVAMPAWSPDEKHVVFLAKWGGILGNEERSQFNLWVVSSEGGAAKPFTISSTAKFGLDWGQ